MSAASDSDLERCGQLGVPIVSCPRSNLFWGMEPPLSDMLRHGITVALGTDNGMTSAPDMLVEMEFAARMLRRDGRRKLDDVIRMATSNGRKVINRSELIDLDLGSACDLTVVRSSGGDPVTDPTLRAAGRSALVTISGGKTWKESR